LAQEQFLLGFLFKEPADFWVLYHHLNKFHHWIKIGIQSLIFDINPIRMENDYLSYFLISKILTTHQKTP
jgi:hypothetical protein